MVQVICSILGGLIVLMLIGRGKSNICLLLILILVSLIILLILIFGRSLFSGIYCRIFFSIAAILGIYFAFDRLEKRFSLESNEKNNFLVNLLKSLLRIKIIISLAIILYVLSALNIISFNIKPDWFDKCVEPNHRNNTILYRAAEGGINCEEAKRGVYQKVYENAMGRVGSYLSYITINDINSNCTIPSYKILSLKTSNLGWDSFDSTFHIEAEIHYDICKVCEPNFTFRDP